MFLFLFLFFLMILGSSVHGSLALCIWDHGGQSLWRMSLFISQRQKQRVRKDLGPGITFKGMSPVTQFLQQGYIS